VVAITGDNFPSTSPVATGRRTRKSTAILLLLGFLSFASVSVLPWLGPEEPTEEHCRTIFLTSDDGHLLTDDSGKVLLTADQPSCGPFH
jgi:hypothetical protein